jgi:hypothetical protein
MLFKTIRQLLVKYSTGRNVILIIVITQIIYFLMLFLTLPNLTQYASGMKVLDLQPTGFSADYAKSLFVNLGSVGREYYIYRQIPLDMIYPFLFAISNALLLTFLFKKSFNHKNKIHHFAIIPLFAGLFDYLENIGIIIMLTMFPNFSSFLSNVTSSFTIFKSISTTLFFVLLVIGIVGFINNKFNKSKSDI